MRRLGHFGVMLASQLLILSLPAARARADVIPVSPAAFGSGSTLITFVGLPDELEVNGLLFGGVQFSYSLGNGHVVIDGGPGVTNNVEPPNIVAVGNPSGVLTLILPGLQNLFGYGYAVLATTNVPNATIVTLFNGATNVGSLPFNALLDPVFAGGFAGVQSTLAFNRVQLTFNAAVAPSFAVDNIRFASLNTVPEPGTLSLVAAGVLAMGAVARRRFRRRERSA